MKIHILCRNGLMIAGVIAAEMAVANPAAAADLLAVPNTTVTAPAVSVDNSALATPVAAAPAAAPGTMAATPAVPAVAATQYTPAQLNELLGPIALYPDALIAIVLPASTEPGDIVLAARFLADGGDASQIDQQPWDDSVKALARYPEVLKWMDDNLAWTKTLGDAFERQPADVMKSVQDLRAQAKAAGTLTDTAQQKVETQDSKIIIVPAQPNVIYVPQYDPQVVYVQQPVVYTQPVISFGIGYAVGPWLGFSCNWYNYGVWVTPWCPGVWYYPPTFWAQSVIIINGRPCNRWGPPPNRIVAINRNIGRPVVTVVPRPHVIAGAPNVPHAGGPAYRYGATPNRPEPFDGHNPNNGVRPVPTTYGRTGVPMASAAPHVEPHGPMPNAGNGNNLANRMPAPMAVNHAPNVAHAGSPAPTFAPQSPAPNLNRGYEPVSNGPGPNAARSYVPQAGGNVPTPSRAPQFTQSAPSHTAPVYENHTVGPVYAPPAGASYGHAPSAPVSVSHAMPSGYQSVAPMSRGAPMSAPAGGYGYGGGYPGHGG